MKQVERVTRAYLTKLFEDDADEDFKYLVRAEVPEGERRSTFIEKMVAEHVEKGAAQAAIAAMWTPFDAEDETTWPEDGVEYLVRMYFNISVFHPPNNFKCLKWRGEPKHWCRVTHYQEIGESDE